jgi:hypothetical protein
VSVHTSKPGPEAATPAGDNPFAVVLHPAPATWTSQLRSVPLTDVQRRFRAQLGLPIGGGAVVDPLIIMSGHQAELWHPGIFAKVAAAHAFAQTVSAAGMPSHTAWLVVDQDANEPQKLKYPALGKRGELVAREWNIDPTPVLAETPTGMRPALGSGKPLSPVPTDVADQALAARLGQLREAIFAHMDAPHAAGQITRVLASLIEPASPLPMTLLATALSRTHLFTKLVDKMIDDPLACIRAYNAAATAFPLSGIRALDESRAELPLWHVRPGEPRRRVLAPALVKIPREELAPRALLMTGLVRVAGCDLFIHGIGGGGLSENTGYDNVTAQWFNTWLGADMAQWGGKLAPEVTASATLRLALPGPDAPSQQEIAHAQWRAHAARHQPSILGDSAGQHGRDALLAQIRTARSRGEQPAAAFRALHAMLDQQRGRHAFQLAALDADAAAFKGRSAESLVRHDRTWSVALHSDASLRDLARAVSARIQDGAP